MKKLLLLICLFGFIAHPAANAMNRGFKPRRSSALVHSDNLPEQARHDLRAAAQTARDAIAQVADGNQVAVKKVDVSIDGGDGTSLSTHSSTDWSQQTGPHSFALEESNDGEPSSNESTDAQSPTPPGSTVATYPTNALAMTAHHTDPLQDLQPKRKKLFSGPWKTWGCREVTCIVTCGVVVLVVVVVILAATGGFTGGYFAGRSNGGQTGRKQGASNARFIRAITAARPENILANPETAASAFAHGVDAGQQITVTKDGISMEPNCHTDPEGPRCSNEEPQAFVIEGDATQGESSARRASLPTHCPAPNSECSGNVFHVVTQNTPQEACATSCETADGGARIVLNSGTELMGGGCGPAACGGKYGCCITFG